MLLVNVAGVALIALIVWWFWLYKAVEVTPYEVELVIVLESGIYQPTRVKIAANTATELHFLRKDTSPCAEMLLFPELEISEILPLNKPMTISLPPLAKGEYAFHCQMQMYRGVLEVE